MRYTWAGYIEKQGDAGESADVLADYLCHWIDVVFTPADRKRAAALGKDVDAEIAKDVDGALR